MAMMTQALSGASEATKKGLMEAWEELAGYPEAEHIAALEDTDQGIEEEEDDDEDDVDMLLALQSTAPAGSLVGVRRSGAPRTVTVGT